MLGSGSSSEIYLLRTVNYLYVKILVCNLCKFFIRKQAKKIKQEGKKSRKKNHNQKNSKTIKKREKIKETKEKKEEE